LFTKPLIFVVTLFLIFTLIYSFHSSSTFLVFAAGPIQCAYSGTLTAKCCQQAVINVSPANPVGSLVRLCTDCDVGPEGVIHNCSERYIDDVAQQSTPTPTPPPTSPFAPPLGGVLQEPTTTTPTTPPPLFGRNVPLQGGGVFGQPTITATTPVPTPPPQFGQIAPEAQVLPPLADDSTFPEDGVLEQPSPQESDEQSSEENGQVIAKDDDDGPVPPECPKEGIPPPDCTMKPFPEERALE
jgi:hypothetical protein